MSWRNNDNDALRVTFAISVAIITHDVNLLLCFHMHSSHPSINIWCINSEPTSLLLINQERLITSYWLAVRIPQPMKSCSRVHIISKCRRALSNPHLSGNAEVFSNALCVKVRHVTPSWVITYFSHSVAA